MKKCFIKIISTVLAATTLACGFSFADTKELRADTTYVVDGKEYSDETGVGGFVARLYTVALDRSYETDGLLYWIESLASFERNGLEVAACFFNSPEFEGFGLSDEEFLNRAYGVFFDREGDAEGKAYWLERLQAGTPRSQVVTEFGYSTEWANVCASFGILSGSTTPATITPAFSDGLITFVTSLYADCLGRTPEQPGIDYWCGRIARNEISGKAAAAGFFSSEEFTTRAADLSNEELIQIFYKVFMNREGDEYGVNYWLEEMSWGAGVAELFAGFANADEFVTKCHSYGINPGGTVTIPSTRDVEVEEEFLEFASWYSDEIALMNTVSLEPHITYNLVNVRTADTTVTACQISDEDLSAIREFAAEHFPSNWTAAQKALYTMWWLNQNLTYGGQNGGYAVSAFRNRTGQCNVYNGALVEMLNYLGFESSLIYGYRGRSWDGRWDHFWGEIYIDGNAYVMESGNYKQSGYWCYFCAPYGQATKYIKNCVVQG